MREEEDGEECRICRGGAEVNRPLFFPCRCSGSIRFTHEDCLVQWLTQSGSVRCELCHYQFRFEREYRPGAPRKLSVVDLASGLIGKLRRLVRSAARVLLVLTVWIFFLPVGTCWTWHAVFLDSPTAIFPLVTSRSVLDVSTDAFYGCILSAGIVLVFFGVSSFWEHIRNIPELADEYDDNLHTRGNGSDHDNLDIGNGPHDQDAHGRHFNEARAEAFDAHYDDDDDDPSDDDDILAPVNPLVAPMAGADHNQDDPIFVGMLELDVDEAPFEPLEEVIGLRGPIRNLFDNAGTVLVSNAILLVVFALVPRLVGRMTQRLLSFASASLLIATSGTEVVPYDRESTVSAGGNSVTILIGYAVIGFFVLLGASAGSMLRNRYPRFDTPLTRQTMRFVQHVGTFLKVVAFIAFEFIAFPFACGWWLDACVAKFLDSSFSAHCEYLRVAPWTSMSLHWLLGILYMILVSLSVSLLREVLRPELLWFIRNPDDPDFNPFREIVEKPLSCHARRMCLSVLIYAPLIILLVFVPLELTFNLMPGVFPLRFALSNPLLDVPIDMLLLHVCFAPAANIIQFARPRLILRQLLRQWISVVGGVLGVEDRVLKNDHRHDVQEPFADAPYTEQDPDGTFQDELSHAHLRMGALLVSTWAVMVLGSCLLISGPTVLGRSVFTSLGIATSHEVYTCACGIIVLLGLFEMALCVRHVLDSMDLQGAVWCAIVNTRRSVKAAVVGVLFSGVIPLLAGLVIERTIIAHFRSVPNEASVAILYQDWALGVVIHKIWIFLVLSERFETSWADRLDLLQNGGPARIDGNFWPIIRHTVGPLLFFWGGSLAGPYLVGNIVIAVAHSTAPSAALSMRYSYLICAVVYMTVWMCVFLRKMLWQLHDNIRDEKYLTGVRLHNYHTRQAATTDGGGRPGSPPS